MSASGIAPARPTPWFLGWLEFTTFVLSPLGLVDSSYQTYTHYSGTSLLGCAGNADGCVVVQHSAESVVVGIGFVLYLIYAELIEIGRICPYCTSVHILTFLLFCLIVLQFAARSPAAEPS